MFESFEFLNLVTEDDLILKPSAHLQNQKANDVIDVLEDHTLYDDDDLVISPQRESDSTTESNSSRKECNHDRQDPTQQMGFTDASHLSCEYHHSSCKSSVFPGQYLCYKSKWNKLLADAGPRSARFLQVTKSAGRFYDYCSISPEQVLGQASSWSSYFHLSMAEVLLEVGVSPNVEYEGFTVLMIAIQCSNISLVKLLLKYGADVNTTVNNECPLSIAAQEDKENVMDWLLQRNADVCAARANLEKQSSILAISRLKDAFMRQRRKQTKTRPQQAQILRQLRRRFALEHMNIVNWTHGNDGGSFEWVNLGFDNRAKKAWRTSLRTLRSLCNGKRPTDLYDTIMFLTLARSMDAITKDSTTFSGGEWSENAFPQDLARWKMLFREETLSFQAFELLTWNLWGFYEDSRQEFQWNSSWEEKSLDEHILDFQHLALNITKTASDILGMSTSPVEDLIIPASRSLLTLENRAYSSFSQRHKFGPLLPRANCSNSTDGDVPPIEQTVWTLMSQKNITADEERHIVVILFAGAIFAAVLAFLLALQMSFQDSNGSRCPLEAASTFYFGLQVQNMKEAVVYALHLAIQKISHTWSVSLVDTFQIVSDRLKNAILFSKATDFKHVEQLFRCHGDEFFGDSGLRDAAIASLELVRPKYSLQLHHCLMEAFLGLEPTPLFKLIEKVDDITVPGKTSPSSSSLTLAFSLQDQAPSTCTSQSANTPTYTQLGTEIKKAAKKTFCDVCNRDFRTTSNYGKHVRDVHEKVRHTCIQCGKDFQRKTTLREHMRKH